MNVAGDRSFAAKREVVWTVLNDPERMAKVMPGVERFEVHDDMHWTAHVLVPLGLGGLRMKMSFEKTEQREPEFAALNAKGEGVGALVNMQTSFNLSEAGGGTAMHWEADVRIAGPVGSMGQRVLQPIVNQQVKNVLNALDVQVMEAASGGGGGESAASQPPKTGDFVTGSEETSPETSPTGSPEAASWGEPSTSEMGTLDTPEPTSDRPPPETDPTLRDEGEPPEIGPEGDPSEVEGSSGAEDGISPWEPDAYETDRKREENEDREP